MHGMQELSDATMMRVEGGSFFGRIWGAVKAIIRLFRRPDPCEPYGPCL